MRPLIPLLFFSERLGPPRATCAHLPQLFLILLAVCCLLPASALAQFDRPGDERPELPPFEAPEQKPGGILPPVPLPREPDTEGLAGGVRIFIRGVRVTGNTALSEEELAEITAPYADREVSAADLEALRDQLTLAYIRRGYVSSGAVFPDQTLEDGTIEFRIVEGTLAELDVETDGRFRQSYLRSRLHESADEPVNVGEIEERLQLLQQDDRIRTVQAALTPGKRRGESILQVRVAEERPYRVRLFADNYESPSIGAEGGGLELAYTNITGFGDSFNVRYRATEGLHDVEARYAIPLNSHDTTLDLHASRSWADVVEDPFDELEIESRSETYGATLRHPFHRSLSSLFEVFLTSEWRRSRTYLLGMPFSFTAGPEDGVAKVAVLRLGQDWSYRTRRQVFAARSMLTWGLDILDATTHQGKVADGEFLAWLGQFQWARRFDFLDAQLIARCDAQLASSPLLGLEQFAVGGRYTVRGYRENTLVRDNGVTGSLEARFPVWRRADQRPILELAAFVDAGHSWNRSREGIEEIGHKTLVSAGVGARWLLTNHIRAEVYWAEALKDVEYVGPRDLQDSGAHFQLSVVFP
jgi:hemolysin activation/secretion protein